MGRSPSSLKTAYVCGVKPLTQDRYKMQSVLRPAHCAYYTYEFFCIIAPLILNVHYINQISPSFFAVFPTKAPQHQAQKRVIFCRLISIALRFRSKTLMLRTAPGDTGSTAGRVIAFGALCSFPKNKAISQRDGLEFSSVLSEKVRRSDHLSRPLSVFRKSLAR